MVRTSNHEGMDLGSTIILSGVTSLSKSDHLAPFVGICGPQASLTSAHAINSADSVAKTESISVVGTALSLESKHLIGGTGPLFSFGLTEHTSSFTNHDSGTGMMSPNIGGNLICLNTSFSSCIRERNKDLNFSFENRTQTHIGRLDSVSSDVTSVSFTLSTFKTMPLHVDGWSGAAINLHYSKSSLTVRTCFFHRCGCSAFFYNGGAINCYYGFNDDRPVSISNSSFCECATLRDMNTSNCGGSLFVCNAFSTVIDRCFFEQSRAEYDGAASLHSNLITVSNTAFVECSATHRAGAVLIENVATLCLSFLQFRGCTCENDPNGKDLFFYFNTSSQITSEMITFCDSTSGDKNIFFSLDYQSDSLLIPQISPTHTVKSVDVSFDGDEATVTVETKEAIKGTMNVLLNGSNVPRLVHAVFGDPSKESTVGTAVVSTGENGILPSAEYTLRKSTLAPFPPPTVHTADATLKDWSTTEIVLRGVSLEEGSYWMLVGKDGKDWNVTLTRSDWTTLTGAAPLSSSNGEVILEWSTE
ncbi:hypothetical protein BLNAU_5058 [Blattamonas nauphoetae]|uniref:Right handed beta helix domain-containing protein n=1 Tax=Blattamonas nauphoetae TaxID=2049346 RepID=A0ABQ9Y7X0_9EUKA|nr:hypothetical protein BLNAU_5058 [Blattamonas nauphoetae]